MAGTRAQQVTIANGAAVSDPFDLNGARVRGVIGDTAWTAADISFEVETRPSSGVFVKVVDQAGALLRIAGVATAAQEYMIFGVVGDAAGMDGVMAWGRARLCSTNTASEANANQGAARTLTVIMEPIEGVPQS